MSDSSSSSCSERTETDADNAGKPTSPGASSSSELTSSASERGSELSVKLRFADSSSEVESNSESEIDLTGGGNTVTNTRFEKEDCPENTKTYNFFSRNAISVINAIASAFGGFQKKNEPPIGFGDTVLLKHRNGKTSPSLFVEVYVEKEGKSAKKCLVFDRECSASVPSEVFLLLLSAFIVCRHSIVCFVFLIRLFQCLFFQKIILELEAAGVASFKIIPLHNIVNPVSTFDPEHLERLRKAISVHPFLQNVRTKYLSPSISAPGRNRAPTRVMPTRSSNIITTPIVSKKNKPKGGRPKKKGQKQVDRFSPPVNSNRQKEFEQEMYGEFESDYDIGNEGEGEYSEDEETKALRKKVEERREALLALAKKGKQQAAKAELRKQLEDVAAKEEEALHAQENNSPTPPYAPPPHTSSPPAPKRQKQSDQEYLLLHMKHARTETALKAAEERLWEMRDQDLLRRLLNNR